MVGMKNMEKLKCICSEPSDRGNTYHIDMMQVKQTFLWTLNFYKNIVFASLNIVVTHNYRHHTCTHMHDLHHACSHTYIYTKVQTQSTGYADS